MSRSLGGPADGTMADYMCISQEGLVRGAGAYERSRSRVPALRRADGVERDRHARIARTGSKVLVQGTGGVALFAIQIAKMLGAHVTVISSSDEKIARAKKLGADAAINYKTTPEWYKATREHHRRRRIRPYRRARRREDAAAVAPLHPSRRDAVDDRRALGRRDERAARPRRTRRFGCRASRSANATGSKRCCALSSSTR
jgi:hypothetical protein